MNADRFSLSLNLLVMLVMEPIGPTLHVKPIGARLW